MDYYRPKTRVELRNKLREGVTCEVASQAVEMTVIMIEGWMGFYEYQTEASPNKGWTIFKPNDRLRS